MERLTIPEFKEIVEVIFLDYDRDPTFVTQVLANDEWSSDEELMQYFVENRFEADMVTELLPFREYFMDFRYVKELDI